MSNENEIECARRYGRWVSEFWWTAPRPDVRIESEYATRDFRTAAPSIEEQRHIFDQKCDTIADVGGWMFPDFDDAISGFSTIGGPSDRLLQCITSIGNYENGARAYYFLGKNPEVAAKVMAMDDEELTRAVTAYAARPK